MLPAIAKTVEHVTERHQFGHPIGSFQAVQHRLARAYVMAEGSKWLARRAAWHHDEEFVTASAATFACQSAEVTYTNTQQVSGAIGVTSEHGLVLWTLRLLALRAALGGPRHARPPGGRIPAPDGSFRGAFSGSPHRELTSSVSPGKR